MRIIVVSTKLPYPLDEGARIRTYSILKCLAVHHEVVLFTFVGSEEERAHIDRLREICADVRYAWRSRSRMQRCSDIALSPLRTTPYAVTAHASREMHDLIKGYDRPCDVAQAEFPEAVQYIQNMMCKKILDEHNVESDILLSQSQHETNILRRTFLVMQYRKMMRYERMACSSVDAVLATSETDKETLASYNTNTYVVPNGVNIHKQASTETRSDIDLLFVGYMRYPANADAVLYFLAAIWPLIKAEEPACRFWVVGREPPAELVNLEMPGVFVTGAVPDVRPYLESARVFVVPLRIGSGTRLKILEAMAFARPVVSTSLGCMGIAARDGDDICIADTPEAFARQVVALLRDARRRQEMGTRGYALVSRHYTWDCVGERLKEIYA